MPNLALLALLLLPSDPIAFRGHQVTVIDPGLADEEGFYPKGEAKVCVVGQPVSSCYTAPTGVGRYPNLKLVELRKGKSALFFEAASGGVSGFMRHFALFDIRDRSRYAHGKPAELENLFPPDLELSDQSQFSWWELPTISASKLFLTADFVWGPFESHVSNHRFMISVYVRRPGDLDEWHYALVDRFMTFRYYGYMHDDHAEDILGAERKQILARLKKVKATWPHELRDKQPR